ncbi:EscU/YscU/HrcU family type III secretion system export apparatus switch protein [Pseudidiomarina donghaiensis]|uniref:Flagellar biosynthetic protein FlhB n=1 Tax=Pseudidiomarina donghaiensis TaxID=519452 RepID=A0A432XH91_9GAMM|nr:EscU/YscU/HrcU family type III secretion system export apparatus switch protein [Pseudidiomarina donghaiensis]RUO47937.1 flagellar biosynthesis protein [Pseudidiomarina donghaiensis]SFV22659.1 flagellar biosynthesis protein [Pseudidiomarina donghaiensis]
MNDEKPKTQKAVALRYQEFEPAPKVVAKGEGLIADKIIALANEHNVFVHDSPELVDLLSQIDLDDYVPQTLWLVVAELLIWARGVDSSH